MEARQAQVLPGLWTRRCWAKAAKTAAGTDRSGLEMIEIFLNDAPGLQSASIACETTM